ncbi:MAG: sugar transferase [Bryobacterales bacterium]|nr:sugar transferase [Bryobacterales bacterium]MBV9398231.1 sugar transferase [Bryobacterales bacterium]
MTAPSIQLINPACARVSPKPLFESFVERFVAAMVLILTAPVIAATALSIAVLSRRSPFIAHRRVGQYGAGFWMLKMRTMWGKEARETPRRWIEYLADTHVPIAKGSSDPRVTSRFARLCRRFSIDELPQLLHVITGRMRLVGPRPITFAEWSAFYGDGAEYVLTTAPGITGLWQVMGRNRLTYAQRRRLDMFYVAHQSLRLDAMILLRTPLRVFTGRDAG